MLKVTCCHANSWSQASDVKRRDYNGSLIETRIYGLSIGTIDWTDGWIDVDRSVGMATCDCWVWWMQSRVAARLSPDQSSRPVARRPSCSFLFFIYHLHLRTASLWETLRYSFWPQYRSAIYTCPQRPSYQCLHSLDQPIPTSLNYPPFSSHVRTSFPIFKTVWLKRWILAVHHSAYGARSVAPAAC